MTPPVPPGGGSGLNVIALVSGGKDSFFSLLHCRANGHRVVALANLHPEAPCAPATAAAPRGGDRPGDDDDEEEEEDLNSFMYQTVGHEVVPLYADATGIPLYRRPITGSAAQSGKEYSHAGLLQGGGLQHATSSRSGGPSPREPSGGGAAGTEAEDAAEDETEAMIPLLRAVIADHPEANALSAGAILSTYQRTRVESVALRLGLTPLAYLWKYPLLPPPPPSPSAAGVDDDDAQLLADMAAAGLEARLVKVATGGMDESFLWENVASDIGKARVQRAMRRFAGGGGGGGAEGRGAVLGEGGEFETLVLDGPRDLFSKRIVVREDDRRVIDEGGGSARLSILRARVEDKPPVDDTAVAGGEVRIPDLLDARFAGVMGGLGAEEEEKLGDGGFNPAVQGAVIPPLGRLRDAAQSKVQQWCAVGDVECRSSIETEASSLVETVRARLSEASLPPTSIINTVIILRHMADFPTVNKIYGSLFPDPNPPSRVTISSGDLLPRNCNIALYLSVHPDLSPSERQGLHVQSRSYWAPANIGPYSQATAFPLSSLAHAEADASSTQLVHIAGQIPLVPATMDLPPGGLETFPPQLALSLQHLWRVGVEMGVQWWSSAVAYIPHDSSHGATIPTIERAKLAAQAWTAAHRWFPPDAEDSDAEGGPDLWDRKFNPLYMSFAESETEEPHTVPDWSVLEAEGPIAKPVPFVFTAEVQELPRQADVEWHAHVGLAHVDAKSVRVVSSSDPSAGLHVQHTVVKTHNGTFIHSVLALERSSVPVEGKTAAVSTLVDELNSLLPRQLSSIAATEAYRPTTHLPTLLYTDSEAVALSADDVQSCPIIPCASLWDSQGKKLAAVAVYQNFFEEAP